ncbi:MAG: hypothetical protein LBT25_05495 [Candidatus Symbiothrix sp.]|jgi:hypothetical protein|nr:hypothetical protein [Candidatus Symbiothrix sp.]
MNQVKFDEQELNELFQVEELEKRYEMGWIKSASYETNSGHGGRTDWVSVSIPI